ncbi:MAG: alternative ribosome rescue aminoacyl-tRNA hydrolase ArfB [Pseudomonadota bacterium]
MNALARPIPLAKQALERYLPDESELSEQFVRSSGAGGQHVNRTDSAVQLRFDAVNSTKLSADARQRLIHLAGHRADQYGVITIRASRHRSQYRNRQAARTRLAELIREAYKAPKPRRQTQPSHAQHRRRLELKKQRSQTVKLRRKPNLGDD